MGLLLDSSFLIAQERGGPGPPDAEEVALAAITASELLQGVHRARGEARARREAFVEGVLAVMPVVPFTLAIARVHARLWADLALAGRLPGAHDLLIGATALALGWQVATLDRRGFRGMPGVELWLPAR